MSFKEAMKFMLRAGMAQVHMYSAEQCIVFAVYELMCVCFTTYVCIL